MATNGSSSDPRLQELLANVFRLGLDTSRLPPEFQRPSNPNALSLTRHADDREKHFPFDDVDSLYRRMFISNTPGLDTLHVECATHDHPGSAAIMEGLACEIRASRLFQEKKWADARTMNERAIRLVLCMKESDPLPNPTAVIRSMRVVEPFVFTAAADLAMQCVHCATSEVDRSLALEWVQEVHCMFESYGDAKKSGFAAFPWKEITVPAEEFIEIRLMAYTVQSTILSELGNTAAAHAANWAGTKHGSQVLSSNPEEVPRGIRELQRKCDPRRFLTKRHPDPVAVVKPQIIDPKLQIRGAWKKLRVGGGPKDGPLSRLGVTSVVWNGKYYVFGGEHASGKNYCDAWVLDLRNLDKGWRRLSAGPWPTGSSNTTYFKAAVYLKRAYIFLGYHIIPVFDLETERWFRVDTKIEDTSIKWETVFPNNSLTRYTVEVIADTMYVFSGFHPTEAIGRNTLVAFNFKTDKWKLLSGTAALQANATLPGPREFSASWVVDNKLYIGYGNAGRHAAFLHGEPEGSQFDHTYEDMWSYDVGRKHWTQEKVRGNAPSLRTEMGYTFNKTWNHAVVFGGYCATLHFQQPGASGALSFTYFGDTFVWSAQTKSWSMVVSKGFPTWRAMGDLVTDQGTGKTYLFGGYTNTEYTPSTRSSPAQSFNDLWELCVDLPNGGFDATAKADFEADDSRFTTLGPWRACFKCGSVGKWLSCAGSCKDTDQRAVFCGVECLKAGWGAHKELNGCRKI